MKETLLKYKEVYLMLLRLFKKHGKDTTELEGVYNNLMEELLKQRSAGQELEI